MGYKTYTLKHAFELKSVEKGGDGVIFFKTSSMVLYDNNNSNDNNGLKNKNQNIKYEKITQ